MRRQRAGEGISVELIMALDTDVECAVGQRPSNAEENVDTQGGLSHQWKADRLQTLAPAETQADRSQSSVPELSAGILDQLRGSRCRSPGRDQNID